MSDPKASGATSVELLTELKGTDLEDLCDAAEAAIADGGGFGWIEGDVKAIEPKDPALKIPHMGWNTLNVINDHPLLAGIKTGPAGLHAYFVHSFHLVVTSRR